MDITEKAKTYVASQIEAFANAIEKAYMQGYNDAVEENSKEHIKIIEDGVEYIDLGLPSGTLWALNNPQLVPYKESQKLNIPSLEQAQELVKFIRWTIYTTGHWDCDLRFRILDAEGRTYTIGSHGYDTDSGMKSGDMYMWYRKDLDSNCKASVFHLYEGHNSIIENNVFPGYKAFAFLVK